MDYAQYLYSKLDEAGFNALKLSPLSSKNNMGIVNIVVGHKSELMERPFFWRATSFDQRSPLFNDDDVYIELVNENIWNEIKHINIEGVFIIFKNTGSIGYLPFLTRKMWIAEDGIYWVDPKLIQPFGQFVGYYLPT